jgi:hypothetical protein
LVLDDLNFFGLQQCGWEMQAPLTTFDLLDYREGMQAPPLKAFGLKHCLWEMEARGFDH